MDSSEQNYIYHILVLKEFLEQLFGPHYPREIIQLIILATYQPIKVVCGYFHNFLISDKIYVWGYNRRGQLGLGHQDEKNSPQEFTFFKRSDVIKIACGHSHTMALVKSNESNRYNRYNRCYGSEGPFSLQGWGLNDSGQLGLGDSKNRNIPQEIILPGEIKSIKSINCGEYHTIATVVNINYLQKCYVWGYNNSGQLGLGDNIDRQSPQELSLLNVSTICCGGAHTIALIQGGKIYSWGYNFYGQLGLGDNNGRNFPQELYFYEDIMSVDCGYGHTICMTVNNKIYGWGSNDFGQLGIGHCNSQNSPQELILPNIISISCGGDHTIALARSGKIYGWGYNFSRQLGLSCLNNFNKPTALQKHMKMHAFSMFFRAFLGQIPKNFPYEIWKSTSENHTFTCGFGVPKLIFMNELCLLIVVMPI